MKDPKSLLKVLAPSVIAALGLWLWVSQPGAPVAAQTFYPAAGADSLRRDVEKLAGGFALRNYAYPEVLARAADYIGERFKGAGGRVELDAYKIEGATYRNVIARFGPERGRPVVIGAHYDAAETTPGADDNASGVAGILALADRFREAPPRVPVELVAYCLEEPPHFSAETMGSRRHARALKVAGREPRLVMVLEMIGYFTDEPGSQRYPLAPLSQIYPDKGNFIGVVGNLASRREVAMVKKAMAAANSIPVESLAAPESVPGISLSDHASYWREGMAAVMITDTAFNRNPNYHQSGDLPDTLDYGRMAGVVQALAQVVGHLEEHP